MIFINCPLILCQANIADFGDNQWVTCFQDSAEILLGQNSSYLGQLKDSVSCFFLPASQSYSSFPVFPSMWYMKVWPWGLASRCSEEQHIVSQLEFFLWCVYEIGIQAQGFLTRSYSHMECSILRDVNYVLLKCFVCKQNILILSCLAFTERSCIWWGLSACKLQYLCLPEPSEAGDLQCKLCR